MKVTGIIRRIDELGRVVLPQDIRRTLHLHEGDYVEIFVNQEGEVILKKYSPVGELGNFAKEYADALSEITGYISMIADRDVIIAVAGANKKEFLNKPIGNAVKQALKERTTLIYEMQAIDDENLHVIQSDDQDYTIKFQVVTPIISQGNLNGAVIIASKEAGVKLGDIEIKMAEIAARLMAKQTEQ